MIARRWHRPSLRALVLAVFGVVAFVWLGIWQLDRAAQKVKLLAAFAAAPHSVPQDVDAVRDVADVERYPHVRIVGHYQADRGYLLDEQAHAGKIGVHAIGVFAGVGEEQLLLVDRGWVQWNHAPGTLPMLPVLPTGEIALTGLYAPYPGGGLRMGGNALPRQSTWPKLTLYLDGASIAADLGKPVMPRVLLLDPAQDSGFVRQWTPQLMSPQRHRAYAVQWFGFAVVALIIFIGQHWRKVENTKR